MFPAQPPILLGIPGALEPTTHDRRARTMTTFDIYSLTGLLIATYLTLATQAL